MLSARCDWTYAQWLIAERQNFKITITNNIYLDVWSCLGWHLIYLKGQFTQTQKYKLSSYLWCCFCSFGDICRRDLWLLLSKRELDGIWLACHINMFEGLDSKDSFHMSWPGGSRWPTDLVLNSFMSKLFSFYLPTPNYLLREERLASWANWACWCHSSAEEDAVNVYLLSTSLSFMSRWTLIFWFWPNNHNIKTTDGLRNYHRLSHYNSIFCWEPTVNNLLAMARLIGSK